MSCEPHTIRIFRKPGARADSFNNTDEYQNLLDWENDLPVLWIGSIDIEEESSPEDIVNTISELIDNVRHNCHCKIIFILPEPRTNDIRVSPGTYRRVVKGMKRRLQNRYKQNNDIKISVIGGLSQYLFEDGLHFNYEGRELIKDRLKHLIRKWAVNWAE